VTLKYDTVGSSDKYGVTLKYDTVGSSDKYNHVDM